MTPADECCTAGYLLAGPGFERKHRCDRPAGHTGPHRDGGHEWEHVTLTTTAPDCYPPCARCGEPASYDVDGVDLCGGCLPPRDEP